MYGGSNELFGRNQNFPLFLNIKLHLKIPVNFNFLNILSFLGGSVPPYHEHTVTELHLVSDRGSNRFQALGDLEAEYWREREIYLNDLEYDSDAWERYERDHDRSMSQLRSQMFDKVSQK